MLVRKCISDLMGVRSTGMNNLYNVFYRPAAEGNHYHCLYNLQEGVSLVMMPTNIIKRYDISFRAGINQNEFKEDGFITLDSWFDTWESISESSDSAEAFMMVYGVKSLKALRTLHRDLLEWRIDGEFI